MKTGVDPLLTICSAGHALHVFVNGKLAGKLKIKFNLRTKLVSIEKISKHSFFFFVRFLGTAYGSLSSPKFTFSQKINLRVGTNKLALLSTAVGLTVSSNLVFVIVSHIIKKYDNIIVYKEHEFIYSLSFGFELKTHDSGKLLVVDVVFSK